MTDYTAIVANALDHLGFNKDDLAYLAMASKVEHPVRDRLALKLRSEFLAVGREFNRADLVAFDQLGIPTLVVELKAMHTSFVTSPAKVDWCAVQIKHVLDSAARKVKAEVEALAVLLGTHLHDVPDGLPEGVVKYAGEIRNALKMHRGNERAVREECDRVVRDRLAGLSGARVQKRGTIGQGSAYGVKVAVDYWVFSR